MQWIQNNLHISFTKNNKRKGIIKKWINVCKVINFKCQFLKPFFKNHFSKTTFNLKVPIFSGVVGVLIPSRHVIILPNPNFVFKDHKPFIGVQSHLYKKDWWRLHYIDFCRSKSSGKPLWQLGDSTGDFRGSSLLIKCHFWK